MNKFHQILVFYAGFKIPRIFKLDILTKIVVIKKYFLSLHILSPLKSFAAIYDLYFLD